MGCCLCCFQKTVVDPKAPRSCTDVIPLLVFLLFLVGMGVITGFAWKEGDPWRIIYGTDSFGNTCGRKNPVRKGLNLSGRDMEKKTSVFAMNILNPRNTVWICVEKCPTNYIVTQVELKQHSKTIQSRLCRYDIDVEEYDNQTNSDIGPCPVLPVFKSEPVLHRCIPSMLVGQDQSAFKIVVDYINSFDKVSQVLTDICTCYVPILIICGVSVVIAFIAVFLIRFVAVVFIYTAFAFVVVIIVGLAAVLWYYFGEENPGEYVLQNLLNSSDIFDAENEYLVLGGAVGTTLIIAVLLITICCCVYQKMHLVVELFQQADRCVKCMPILLLQPLWTFLALTIFVIYWFFVTLLLATSSGVKLSQIFDIHSNASVQISIEDFSTSIPVKYLWWYHLVGLIWVTEFIMACQEMVIAGSVAVWYFSKDKDRVNCAVCKSTWIMIRYHMGSLALGSLIITMVKIPRLILMYLQQKYETTGSLLLKYAIGILICFLWCVEKCLKYIHQNAYTIIAIEGSSFCPAAVKACTVLISNALQVTTINLLGDFVLFIGKLGVTALVGLIGTVVFKPMEDVRYWFVPVIVVCLFAYFVSHCFFSVYEMIIDTLFICHCEYKRAAEEKGEVVVQGKVADTDAVDATLISFIDKLVDEKNKKEPHKRKDSGGSQKHDDSSDEEGLSTSVGKKRPIKLMA